jgi:hypothetical protein
MATRPGWRGATLQAPLVIAKVRIGAIGLIGLHPGAFVCFVTSYNAAGRWPQYAVVPHIMARDDTDDSTFKATFCVR